MHVHYGTAHREVRLNHWLRERGPGWLLFLLLLVAGATRWMVVGTYPEAQSTLGSLTLGCLWAALVSATLLQGKRPVEDSRTTSVLISLLGGGLLFAGPAIGILMRAQALDATSLTMALSLTAVVVGIAAAALGATPAEGAAGRMWPGLAAVGGLLLLLAEPNLSDVKADIALVLAPVLTGVGAALLGAGRGARRTTAALLGGLIVYGCTLALQRVLFRQSLATTLSAVACDGVVALLSVVALRRVGATRWSAQFTLLPLLIVLEGVWIVRPALTARWVVGIALLTLASVYLLLPQSEDLEPPAIAPE